MESCHACSHFSYEWEECRICKYTVCVAHYDKRSKSCVSHAVKICKRCSGYVESVCSVPNCLNLACSRDGCGKKGNAMFYCETHIRTCISCECTLSPSRLGLDPSYGRKPFYMCFEDFDAINRLFVYMRLPRDVRFLILKALAETPPYRRGKRLRLARAPRYTS